MENAWEKMANFQRDKRETLFKSASDTISGKRQKTSEARHQSWGYYCILTSSLGWLTMHFSSSSKTEMWWPSWMQFKYRMKGASKLFSLWAKMRIKPKLKSLLQKINWWQRWVIFGNFPILCDRPALTKFSLEIFYSRMFSWRETWFLIRVAEAKQNYAS